MSKEKAMSFRQRLRAQSAERLDAIATGVARAADAAMVDADTDINVHDVMRLLCAGQTKTLREQLITELSNEAEAELEKIYNRQIGLLPEGDDSEKE